MKILFTRFPYESTHGGAEVQTISLMTEFKKRGHNVAFLGSCPTLLVMCEQFNIPSLSLKIGRPPVSKWTLITFFFRKRKMKKKLEKSFHHFFQHGLEAVCMMSLSEKLLLTPYAIKAGMKVIWIEHDSIGKWLTLNPFLRRLVKLSKNVKTICVSELSRSKYIKLGWDPKTVIAIPNGIDPTRFEKGKKQSAKKVNESKPIQIGAVARLDHEKGLDILIKSMEELPNAELTIVGVGDQEKYLQSLIKKVGISDRASIIRRIGKLGDFYESIDIFVLPSRSHDPFGLVAAEALCVGTPVVVTDACGIASELKQGKNALIVKAGSEKELKSSISALTDNKKTRLSIGKEGKKKALKDFTIKSMVDNYESLLLK